MEKKLLIAYFTAGGVRDAVDADQRGVANGTNEAISVIFLRAQG